MQINNSLVAKFVAALMTVALAGCATRPINPQVEHFDPKTTYQYNRVSDFPDDHQNLIVLAFSGGWYARSRLLLRRAGNAAGHGGQHEERQENPRAR